MYIEHTANNFLDGILRHLQYHSIANTEGNQNNDSSIKKHTQFWQIITEAC
jgi:hypothetical protein